MLLLIAYVGTTNYPGLTIRGIRFLTGEYIFLGLVLLLVTSLGGWIGSQIISGKRLSEGGERAWDVAAMVVGSIALFAYCFWFRDFFLNPILLLRTFLGTYRPDRTNIEATVGLTSLVNVAPVFFSIYSYRLMSSQMPVRRHLHVMLAALVIFTIFRVYAWSERLALIEAAVPFGLASAAWCSGRSSGKLRAIVRLGPFIAIPGVILYFGLAESVRSWASTTYNQHPDFWQFAIGRFASYYYTSLNNGAGLLATGVWPSFKFENTLNWLHKAPLAGPMFSYYVDYRYSEIEQFLRRFGDLEFNNQSGNFSIIYDLGLPLGITYFAIVGFFGGLFYRAYKSGTFAGALFYPMFFLEFLEVFREPYFSAPRAFTWMLGIGVAFLVDHYSARKLGVAHVVIDGHANTR